MKKPRRWLGTAIQVGAMAGLSALTIAAGPWMSKDECQAKIRAEGAPFEQQRQKIWIQERLFVYVEVLKLYTQLLDHNPGLRAEIEDFRQGRGSRDELVRGLNSLADQTSGYADSLERVFGMPFYWHSPRVHVEESDRRRVYVALSEGAGELHLELGPSSQRELERIQQAARQNIEERIGLGLDPSGTGPVYSSAQDFLTRRAQVPAYCFYESDPLGTIELSPPPSKESRVVFEESSFGRDEGGAVMGFPVGHVQGRVSAVGASDASEVAPATAQPAPPSESGAAAVAPGAAPAAPGP